MAWQDNFAAYTTSVAFSVSLSKAQVRALEAIATDTWLGGGFTMFFATAGALERRGLSEFNYAERDNHNWKGWRYRLTPAGKLVLELARMSGAIAAPQLFDEAA